MAYSKSAWAKALGISTRELENKARAAGYSTTEEYYNATGGSGKTSQDIVNEILNASKSEIDAEVKWLKDYQADNPFIFDEQLAKQSSTQEYEPYYSELLDDYLSDVGVKRTSVEDDAKLSQYLNKLETTQTSREYNQAIANAEEGYAGSGMFFSGIKKRATNILGIQKEEEMGRLGTVGAHEQKDYGAALSSLDTEAMRKQRDIGREKETAIAGGIENRRGETQKAYWTPLTQSYYRRFPTSGNVLAGYAPQDYLSLS